MNTHQTRENRISPGRLNFLYALIALLFTYYGFRLFTLQIVEGDTYADLAYENRHTTEYTQTTRGLIYDRNGYVLARNVASFNVVITPAYLPDDESTKQQIYRELGALIDMPAAVVSTDDEMAELARTFSPCQSTEIAISQIVYIAESLSEYDPMRIRCDIDEETARIIREKQSDWPGISIQVEPIREYPTGELTAEVIGFLGPIPAGAEQYYPGLVPNRDKVGYSGIEQSMQAVLGGLNGRREVEVDVAGLILGDLELPIEPIPGSNIRLTIDTRLQAVAKASLKKMVDHLHDLYPATAEYNGVVIAMNPKTGEILSLVSYPTYENNRMARLIPAYYYEQLTRDQDRPLFNHAISAEHAPGSVFKMAAAIGILNEGVVSPDDAFEDPGIIYLTEKYYENDPGKPRPYYCYTWQEGGHGIVNYLRGIAESCDVYFYKVGGGYGDEVEGNGLGIWRLGEYAKALGYGQFTGIELPGEQNGHIPDPDWKRLVIGENWSTGDTYIGTIGQGYVLTTPLQVLRSFATLANNGIMVRPTLIREILDQEGHVIRPFEPTIVADITKPSKLRCEKGGDGRCEIDVLDLCDLETGLCRTSLYNDEIDPDYEPRMGGVIQVMDENGDPTGEELTVAPWVIKLAQEGMREVVTNGTARLVFEGMVTPTAGKTGTAEYCDARAQALVICQTGKWPAHAWYAGYGPYDNPEIVVVAFVYHGQEGSVIAAPVVRDVLEAYFNFKSIDGAAPQSILP